MTELERLRHLLEHWIEHNRDHVKRYQEWSDKAEAMGEGELSQILRDIASENEKLEGLFKKALRCIEDG